MVNFRLPDFRFLRIFRDRQQKTTDNDDVSRSYPEPASIPNAWWRQSQSRSRQYPVYFNSSAAAGSDSGPWHGYPSHPSQANPPAYPSRLQTQYQAQQQQQYHQGQNRPPPQVQSKPRPQTSHAAFYPNNGGYTNSTSNPNSSYRHRNRHSLDGPPDNQKSGINTPFNPPQPYPPPQPVQSSVYQGWTNVSRVPSHHEKHKVYPTASLNGHHKRRTHSQGSNTRGRATASASPKRSASNAPQIKSRMLNISLIHPLVCGHRHSLIPDQIPETEIGKPEKSVWDSQQFSLAPGSQVPMMIDAVQVCSLSLDWDITLPPSFAKETGRNGQAFTPPRHLHLPFIDAKFKSEVCIKTRQDNPLTKCFLRWGCIVVESRDPNGIPPTMKQFLYDIWDYFHTALTEEECLMFTRDDLAKLRSMAERRVEKYAKEGEEFVRGKGPTRRDVLWGYTRFAGLEVCPRFPDTGDLFLYLEPL